MRNRSSGVCRRIKPMTSSTEDLLPTLRRFGLIGEEERPECTPLAGGVSSDIWRVYTSGGPVCIKRARSQLKVAADWRAPVERNVYEVRWFETVGRIIPAAAPRILGHDQTAGLFAMEYLNPEAHRLWKTELREGRVDVDSAAEVGRRIARIHSATADDPAVAERFATDDLFYALRLEPYLQATAAAHPDLSDALADLIRVTAGTRKALVHGDISPKNILMGANGPVFIDAECAWYGDPAFDVAFCLNHLLLKCLWTPAASERLLAAFAALADSYLAGVTWEPAAAVDSRAAHLLPGLFLARVDGKSPVEYLTEERDKERVRRTARALLADPVESLDAVAATWRRELAQ